MKKKAILSAISVLILTGLVACSPKSSESKSSTSKSTEITKKVESSTTSESNKQTEESTTETNPTSIKEVAKSTQAAMDKMYKESEVLTETYSGIDVKSEGNDTLVMTYTYKDGITEENMQNIKDSLEQKSDQLVAGTKTDAEQLKTAIPEYKAKYIYKTSNGEVLYEKLVTKEDYDK